MLLGDLKEYDDFHIAVNINKDVTMAEQDVFKNINTVLINYDVDVKDWLKVNVRDGALPEDALVRCRDDNVIRYN